MKSLQPFIVKSLFNQVPELNSSLLASIINDSVII